MAAHSESNLASSSSVEVGIISWGEGNYLYNFLHDFEQDSRARYNTQWSNIRNDNYVAP